MVREFCFFSVTQLCARFSNGNMHEFRAAGNCEKSRLEGTIIHAAIEAFLHHGQRAEYAEAQVACAHAERCAKLLGGRLEYVEREVRTPSNEVGGIADACYRMSDRSLAIIDWKYSSHITSSATHTMSEPFEHLPACAVAEYALQLAVYARLFERYEGEQVSALIVCNVRTGEWYDLPFLRAEADALIDLGIGLAAMRGSAFPCCVDEKRTAIHPVLCHDRLIRSRRAALQRGIRFRENAYLRARASTEVNNAFSWDQWMRRSRLRKRVVWKKPGSTISIWFANWEPRFF